MGSKSITLVGIKFFRANPPGRGEESMRPDRFHAEIILRGFIPIPQAGQPFGPFATGPFGVVETGHWAEIYRIARERTAEALRPTQYDRALRASIN
jgi:hypothetical protein